ncbi:MAG: hypothetical protein PWP72_1421 [Thermoanaerobacter sp.]|nr:hypothetical protein [Thermoanaerobacter sp.]
MRIVFENSLERQAWELFLEAHRKWCKNHGDELADMVHFMAEIFGEGEEVRQMAVKIAVSPEDIRTEDGKSGRREGGGGNQGQAIR